MRRRESSWFGVVRGSQEEEAESESEGEAEGEEEEEEEKKIRRCNRAWFLRVPSFRTVPTHNTRFNKKR